MPVLKFDVASETCFILPEGYLASKCPASWTLGSGSTVAWPTAATKPGYSPTAVP